MDGHPAGEAFARGILCNALGLALDASAVPLAGALRNLVMVTAGNVGGGTLLVAGVYRVAYLRGSEPAGRPG